ncbi:MAG: response regulator transcription factor [Lentimicrobiaceae bacterium]|nr:response regulator transcription factor [Lentimicrobiaceae bacterium]MBQ4548360.1 response regulator transcription factor [Bacteroidales bacterium]MBR2051349.1 response regulator transcription factor [Bacteroidales bacterium]
MIRCVIVEDEEIARRVLKSLLAQYCQDVMVCAEADDVASGKNMIEMFRPDLVFLDIEMPGGSGFKLLSSVENIDFEVVFITAYEQFAIKAIRHDALDYILKPIDPKELVAAVEKVKEAKYKKTLKKQYDNILKNLDPEQLVVRKISLSTTDKIHLIDVDDIIRCESDNYYTKIFFKDGNSLLVSKTLKEIDQKLEEYDFVRTHKSHLVNIRYIKNFIKDEMMVVMADDTKVPVSKRKKERILEVINNL